MNLVIRLKLKGKQAFGPEDVMTLFVTVFGTYILWSYLVTGLFMGNFRAEQPLYVLNLLAFWLLLRKSESPFHDKHTGVHFPKDRWAPYFGLVIAAILLLSVVSLMMHGPLQGAQVRFPSSTLIISLNCWFPYIQFQ